MLATISVLIAPPTETPPASHEGVILAGRAAVTGSVGRPNHPPGITRPGVTRLVSRAWCHVVAARTAADEEAARRSVPAPIVVAVTVLTSDGGAVRETFGVENSPIRWSVLGLIDFKVA